MRRSWILTALFSALLLASGGSAQNLVENGDFDIDTLFWLPADAFFIVPVHSLLDADDSPSSGSVLVRNTAPNGLNSGATQCIDSVIQEGRAYDFGGAMRVPSGGAIGQAFLKLSWRTDSCFTILPVPVVSFGASGFDTWLPFEATGLVAPPGADSAQIFLQVIKNLPDVLAYEAHYDNIFLTSPIFDDGFESGDTCEWTDDVPPTC